MHVHLTQTPGWFELIAGELCLSMSEEQTAATLWESPALTLT